MISALLSLITLTVFQGCGYYHHWNISEKEIDTTMTLPSFFHISSHQPQGVFEAWASSFFRLTTTSENRLTCRIAIYNSIIAMSTFISQNQQNFLNKFSHCDCSVMRLCSFHGRKQFSQRRSSHLYISIIVSSFV